MKKKHIILISMVSAGVLLTGIGTGIALKEYTSMEYGGVKQIGEVKMQTKQTEYPIVVSQETGVMDVYTDTHIEVKEDPNVPEGKIRLSYQYNESVLSPVEYQDDYGIRFYFRWNREDDFRDFMDTKDEILKDIKEGKIYEYRHQTLENTEILVNPASNGKIRIR